ncbi:MAG: GNAT family N-acetyltransferase [Myxococcota bacterium]|nr:GNAT family N-acetyltransferase [Myxococcota bacterium]
MTLDNRCRKEILELLLSDQYTNLFLIDILMRRGISTLGKEKWCAVRREGNLVALAVSFGRRGKGGKARLIVPYGNGEACQLLGKHHQDLGGSKMIIGPREASDCILQGMGNPKTRIHYNQRLYACTETRPGESIKIRYATKSDLPQLIDFSAEMIKEDLLEDPRLTRPKEHISSVQHRVENHKTLVADRGDKICFTLNVGTFFRMGCQVGGTYVPKEFRGQGLSVKGMRAACLMLLQRCNVVTLHVNEANEPAIRCYHSTGFQPNAAFRLSALT